MGIPEPPDRPLQSECRGIIRYRNIDLQKKSPALPEGSAGLSAQGDYSLIQLSIHPSFEVISREDLPDIHAEGILLKHKKSGARIALIPCDDCNKVFYIAFRTPPRDSRGAAHIVEHTVLCGSEKYPLKDPFIELMKGSMNTYLNATTYPDKTMFPVASTNDRDFRNLVDVYLDGVFHPNIYKEKNLFRQEGWMLRLEKEDDPLTLGGVVYNEMKGAYSSPEEILDRRVFMSLFPDTSYAEESGGDPDCIPELTYEAFLAFHRKYYHPSNSYLYFYGDFDINETLSYLHESYLGEYEYSCPDSDITEQEPFLEPVFECTPYPVASDETDEGKSYLSMNFVTGDREDLTAQIAVDILDYALFSMPGTPVREALSQAGIGDEVYGSFSDGIAQPYFSVIAKNAGKEDFSRFRSIVLETLEKTAEEGIDPGALLAGINSMEFQFREADYSTWPKGLIYGIDMMDSWLYDDNAAFDPLKQLASFEELRRHAENNDGYFESLIREKFIDNPFRADVVLYPERGLQERNDRKTEERLCQIKSQMSAEEIRRIADETLSMREYQESEESEEALASLPTLRISDITKQALKLSNIPYILSASGKEAAAVRHETDSHGIGYIQLFFRADGIPEEQLVYLALLRSVLLGVNTKSHRYTELINIINARTGGIATGITAFSDRDDRTSYKPYFVLRGRALYRENDFLCGCFAELLTETEYENEKRIREILAELYSRQQMVLTQSGQSTAVMRALSYENGESAFHDAVSGIRFYRELEELHRHFDKKKNEIFANLRAVSSKLFCAENLIIGYTCEKEGVAAMESGLISLLETLPQKEKESERECRKETQTVCLSSNDVLREGFITGGQVQHIAMAGDFGREGYQFSGILHVLRHILNYGYLWDRIRIDGNAYGCGASFTRNGCGTLMSYRDPNLKETLDVFRELPAYLESFDADPEEMEKYIIGTLSAIDTPLTASLFGSVSMRAYMSGTTQEQLDREREEIFRATAADIRAAAPLIRAMLKDDAYCVVGSERALMKDASVFRTVDTLL